LSPLPLDPSSVTRRNAGGCLTSPRRVSHQSPEDATCKVTTGAEFGRGEVSRHRAARRTVRAHGPLLPPPAGTARRARAAPSEDQQAGFGFTVYAVEVGPDEACPPAMEAAAGRSCARLDGLQARSSRPRGAAPAARHHTDPSVLPRRAAHPIAATTTADHHASWQRARRESRRAPRQAHNGGDPHLDRHTQGSRSSSAVRLR
jgi:hypothetical protein